MRTLQRNRQRAPGSTHRWSDRRHDGRHRPGPPKTRRSRKPAHRLEALIPDLILLRRYLAPWRGTTIWKQAGRLAGAEIAGIAAALCVGSEQQLLAVIREWFRPKGVDCPGAERDGDNLVIGVRAVAAHAALSRFDVCLDLVRYAPTEGNGRSRKLAGVVADDLLNAMTRQCDQGETEEGRNSREEQDELLIGIICQEAVSRLRVRTTRDALVRRIRQHVSVFRGLVEAVRKPT